MVSGAFLSFTKIISSIRILIVCTSCKMSCNVLSHSHWGLGQFFVGGGGVKKRQSPDFRSPEVGISGLMTKSFEKYIFKALFFFGHSLLYFLFYLGFRMSETLVCLLFFLSTGKLLE